MDSLALANRPDSHVVHYDPALGEPEPELPLVRLAEQLLVVLLALLHHNRCIGAFISEIEIASVRNVGEAQVLQGLDILSDDLGEPILVHGFNEICREDVTRGLLPFLDDVCQAQTVG